MVTRILTEADAPAFFEVRSRALREEPEAFAMTPDEMTPQELLAERFEAEWNGQSAFVLGALDPTLVGITGCLRERHAKRRHAAVIWGMYVIPERRGHGVGRRLLLDVIERAREWPDLEQLWLDVTATNAAACALYRSCGFQLIGVRRRALRVGDRYHDQEMMALALR
jgi:RimJ/RimL family protein N-acetyltransferase